MFQDPLLQQPSIGGELISPSPFVSTNFFIGKGARDDRQIYRVHPLKTISMKTLKAIDLEMKIGI
jgi:hypothetical protein